MRDRLQMVPLGELAEINPPVTVPGTPDAQVSFIPMTDVSDDGEWVNRQSRPLRSVRSGYTRFVEGDVLFAKITPCMENGKGAHATGLLGGIGFGSTEFHVLRARESADPRFIFHWTQAEALRHAAEASMTGSAGQRRVPARFLSTFAIPKLSIDEQRGIAEVLDTADQAIRKTEALIAKLKQMKQGLLHDLLTCGLDDNGELRDPVAHPEQFMESELGQIPLEWKVCALAQLSLNKGDYGSGAAAIEYDSSLPRYVRITDIAEDGVLNPATRASITWNDALSFMLREHDLLFARSGATVGKTYLYDPLDGDCAHAGYVIKFSLDPTVCLPKFVAYWTLSATYWRQVLTSMRQGAQPNINAREFAAFAVPCPPLQEQRRIVHAFAAHSERIIAEERYLAKLRLLKKGLMQDLLAGRVRVSLPEAEPESELVEATA